MAKICPLFSSSSGNCVYISFGEDALLVDAGVNAKRILGALSEREIDESKIRAIFITHTHNDHISALRVLQKKLKVPVFASAQTLENLCAGNLVCADAELYDVEQNADRLGFCRVDFFHTSHDCDGSGGYSFNAAGHKVSVCTDLGVVSEQVRNSLKNSDLVYFESNHDVVMLQKGSYPPYLKRRILGEGGHLSNAACAAELPALLECGAKKFILGHLSKENNLPVLARSAASASLMNIGAREQSDYMLYVAPPSGGRVVYF